MLSVGLTGSIAVGKSSVSSVFAELGCHIIDADLIARAVVAPGTRGLLTLTEIFGADILQPDGSLDRQRLGRIVFADEEKRRLLNDTLHPLIIAAQDEAIREIVAVEPQAICVVDAALMIESGSYRRFPVIIVVYCRPEIQLARLIARDHLTSAAAAQRIAAQMPQEEKKKYADYTIDTSEGYTETRRQVRAIYQQLRALESL